jgi:lipopolysaccharide export system permease protein
MILTRYLSFKIFSSFAVIFVVLLGCALGQAWLQFLNHSIAGKMPLSLLFPVLLYDIPELSLVILPLSYFLSIFMAYGRLYGNSELIVMEASGLSWWTIVKIPFMGSLIVAALILMIQLYNPAWQYNKAQLIHSVSIFEQAALLQPGRFQRFGSTAYTVYVDKTNSPLYFEGVFMHQANGSFYRAEKAHLEMNSDGATLLILEKGRRVDCKSSGEPWQVTSFERFGQIVHESHSQPETARRMMSLEELYEHDSANNRIEIHMRLSYPVRVILLTLLAVGWSPLQRGQGPYSRILIGLIVFILYFNFLTMCKRVEISPWWIHGVMSLFAGYGLKRGWRV